MIRYRLQSGSDNRSFWLSSWKSIHLENWILYFIKFSLEQMREIESVVQQIKTRFLENVRPDFLKKKVLDSKSVSYIWDLRSSNGKPILSSFRLINFKANSTILRMWFLTFVCVTYYVTQTLKLWTSLSIRYIIVLYIWCSRVSCLNSAGWISKLLKQ